ncbi:MAG TPA: hypothetical protein PK406_08165 [Verrucomicrobiota bacterium]|nr:hypothetical protein [Verrucomicrobiota bacterium]
MPAEQSESLLDLDAQQLSLLPDDGASLERSLIPDDPRNPAFSAARFFKSRPHEYKLAARMCLVDGLPVATVAKALGASRNLIAAIVEREGGARSVEHLKRVGAQSWGHLGRMSRESLLRLVLSLDADDLKADQRISLLKALGVVAGIAADKEQLLLGQATARLETMDGEPGQADVAAWLLRLRDAARAAGMGLGEEAGGQRGGGAGGLEGAVGAGGAAGEAAPGGAGERPAIEAEVVEEATLEGESSVFGQDVPDLQGGDAR